MRIVKKAKLPKVTCKLCGCVYRADKEEDLKSTPSRNFPPTVEYLRSNIFVICPTCGLASCLFAEEGANDEQR